jgi:hypothetical protein
VSRGEERKKERKREEEETEREESHILLGSHVIVVDVTSS